MLNPSIVRERLMLGRVSLDYVKSQIGHLCLLITVRSALLQGARIGPFVPQTAGCGTAYPAHITPPASLCPFEALGPAPQLVTPTGPSEAACIPVSQREPHSGAF